MDCCHHEIVGRVDVGADRAFLYNVDKKRTATIEDNWNDFSVGDTTCNSVGQALTWSQLYLLPVTDEIARMYRDWRPIEKDCKDYTVTQGPGPKEINTKDAIGASTAAVLGRWDCCPKHPTEHCASAKGQFDEERRTFRLFRRIRG